MSISDSDEDELLNEDGEDLDDDQHGHNGEQDGIADSSEEQSSVDQDYNVDARNIRVRLVDEVH